MINFKNIHHSGNFTVILLPVVTMIVSLFPLNCYIFKELAVQSSMCCGRYLRPAIKTVTHIVERVSWVQNIGSANDKNTIYCKNSTIMFRLNKFSFWIGHVAGVVSVHKQEVHDSCL